MNPIGGIAAAALYAPKKYWELDGETKKRICNGCGPRGVFDFVGDSIWGVYIGEACNIHDYMYHVAEANIKAKEEADRVFLNNMLRLIEAQTKKRVIIFKGKVQFNNPLMWLRRKTARHYYLGVKYFGAPAFWNGKNEEGTLHLVRSYHEVKYATPDEKFYKLTPKY